jgi:hypothetical protein
MYPQIPWELFADPKGSRGSHFGNRSSRGLQPVSVSEKTRIEGCARPETNCRDVMFAIFRIMQVNTEIVSSCGVGGVSHPQLHVALHQRLSRSLALACTTNGNMHHHRSLDTVNYL